MKNINWEFLTNNEGTLSNSTSKTDETGKATVTIVSNTIGSGTITASAEKGSSNTTVVFDSIPAIVNTLTLTAAPESLNADGVSKSSIIVTVKDSSNNPVNGVTVNWSKNIADTTLSVTQGTTDSNGQTTVELIAGNTSGVVTVTATTANGSGNKNITLNAVAVAPATIELAANPTTIKADGASTSTLTATLKDGSGNILPAGTEVNWTTTEGTLANAKSVTNGSGQATNTLTSSTKTGVSTITATSGSTSKSTDVTFEGGYLTFASLTATPSTIKADNNEKTTVIATIKDESGNTVGSGVKVNFYHNLGSFGTLSSSSATTNGAGQASVTFNGSIAGSANIEAEIVEDDSPYESVQVTLTPVADYNVSMTATPNRIKNDNIEYSNIVSHVTNDDGTPAVGVKVYFDGNGTLSANSAITDSNGDATVRFTSSFEGFNSVFSIPEGADQSKAANTFVEVYDVNGSNGVVSLYFEVTKDGYQTTETDPDGVNTTTHQNIYGNATATLTDINGSAIANKQILLECISGASCLSGDGSEVMTSKTLTTNSRGRVTSSYFKVDNENAGDLIFRATYVEDTNVYKTYNVSQFGVPNPPL